MRKLGNLRLESPTTSSVHVKVYLVHMMLPIQKVLNAPYKYKPICGFSCNLSKST